MISSAAQQTFDEQLRPRNNESESFKSLDEVYSWLEHMTMKHNFTKLYSIGKSAEGREINVFSIKRPIRSNYFYSKAVIEAALHGNEWQSTYSTLYMIEQVLNAKKGQYAALKNKYFLYFIPVANPDGYVYSQDYDRLWIKNRRKTGADAYGVNLNRNFDYNFGEFDSSDDPHSQYYRGPHPFSEPETAHLRDFITKKGNQLAFYLSVHGHGQRFILPYSDSTKHVVNYHEVQVHARKAISYIVAEHTRRHFNYQPYKIGLASEIYGKRYSGDSASWVKKTFQAPFTCTVQVSDVGEMGIAVQNTNLPSIGKEMAQELTNFMMSTRHYRSYDEDSDDFIKVDYWRPPGVVNKPVDMLIDPEGKKLFMRSMEEKEYPYTTVIEDVQRTFELQTIKPYIRRKMDSFDWTSYFSLKDIYNWYVDLERTYPKEVAILHLGRTDEMREILGLKVVVKGSKRRSAVIVEGGIHAREWIAPAFVTYFVDQLLKSRGDENTELGKIAKTYEFYFIPVMNPDGYEYSMKQDRMWRKNRSGGHGVDINRNFDAGFGTTGVSSNKKEEIYCGPHAFSEKESQAMKNLVARISDKLEYYLAFHSYGQYMIIPYAHIKRHSANYDEVYPILKQAKAKIQRRFGTKYTIGTAYETVGYTTSGVSGCWVKKTYNVPYVATFELRDGGRHGFALPPKQILPTCQETLDGIVSILLAGKGKFRKLNDSEYIDRQGNNVLDMFALFVATFELRDSGGYGFSLPPEQILPTCQEMMDGIETILAPRAREFQQMNDSGFFHRAEEVETRDLQSGAVVLDFYWYELVLIVISHELCWHWP
ncbi:zinc carboxypeptidase domain-containing protein [Phthorimaea operculella]|nr:zinc carboxypeptidase domain-containing protein [Phthorimaea operculella]